MTINYNRFLIIPLALLVAALSTASRGEANDEESKRCVNSRTIKRTGIVSDNHIVFYLRGGKIYLNTLPRTCTGLSRERRFAYETHTSSLCEFDLINVLLDSGFGAVAGRTCKLGRFQRVTEDDVAYLVEQLHKPPQPERVEPPRPEDVTTDDAGDDDPE